MSDKYITRKNPALYEINTVPWLWDLSHKLGKTIYLGNIPSKEWDKLKNLGMDYIWLMGVWQRSPTSLQICLNNPQLRSEFAAALPDLQEADIIGSPYAIQAYEPDPRVGNWQDLQKVRNELRQRGIGLILDFVPNHTARDHVWVKQHPEYYIQGTQSDFQSYPQSYFEVAIGDSRHYIANGRDPYFPSWTDTAQLNIFNPALRSSLINEVKKLSNYCDGLRCDMAMLALNSVFAKVWDWNSAAKTTPLTEFWQDLTQAVPGLLYIAEAYWDTEWQLQQLGFDFTYDKRLYDRLKNNLPSEVFLHLKADIGYQQKLMRFIENHDEQRNIKAFGTDKVRPAAALYSLLPGMRMFFEGQLSGRQVRTPVQLRRHKTEAINNDIEIFYHKLLEAGNSDISHSGSWKLKTVYQHADNKFANLLAYTWQLKSDLLLVMVNLSSQSAQGRVVFQEDIDESQDYSFKEIFSGTEFIRPGLHMAHPGLIFELSGFQAQIFEIKNRGNT